MNYATDSSFEHLVLRSRTPVIVEFPRHVDGEPVYNADLTQLEDLYGNQLTVVRMNHIECSTVVKKFKIFCVPTFIFFKSGRRVSTMIGRMSASDFRSIIDRKLIAPKGVVIKLHR